VVKLRGAELGGGVDVGAGVAAVVLGDRGALVLVDLGADLVPDVDRGALVLVEDLVLADLDVDRRAAISGELVGLEQRGVVLVAQGHAANRAVLVRAAGDQDELALGAAVRLGDGVPANVALGDGRRLVRTRGGR
jgi:hypothetical protein